MLTKCKTRASRPDCYAGVKMRAIQAIAVGTAVAGAERGVDDGAPLPKSGTRGPHVIHAGGRRGQGTQRRLASTHRVGGRKAQGVEYGA